MRKTGTYKFTAIDGEKKDAHDYYAEGIPPPEPELDPVVGPLDWMKKYILSQEELDAMQNAEFIVDGLVVSGQLTIIAAKPGRGKTTILMHAMREAASKGYTVMYCNMDCGAADVGYWMGVADAGGFVMLTPHFDGSDGVKEWTGGLVTMANTKADLSKVIIVVDTLKKVGDLMTKSRVKEVMSMLRQLTTLGCAVVCAAHCNKHLVDGNLVFEGTGDIESDCDNLIYLESEKDSSGLRTVSTVPSDKTRAVFIKRTYLINEDRSVQEVDDYIDVGENLNAKADQDKHMSAIEVIKDGIRKGKHSRVDLHNHAKENHIQTREFDKVLKDYCEGSPNSFNKMWRNEKLLHNNMSHYTLTSEGGVYA